MKQFVSQQAPSICTPITGETETTLLSQLDLIVVKDPDIIEWRADFFHELSNIELVLKLIQKIKNKTDIPLLFTIRSEHEGGEKIALTETEKVELLEVVCEKTSTEMIDYEASNKKEFVQRVKKAAAQHHKKVILSYHNFTETPNGEEILYRAQQAVEYGADVAKFAVMPRNKEDVFRLLHITRKLDKDLEIPVITMSMGELGAISRVIGWVFGSQMTFGVGVESSAPGQIPIGKLRVAIEQTRELVPEWE